MIANKENARLFSNPVLHDSKVTKFDNGDRVVPGGMIKAGFLKAASASLGNYSGVSVIDLAMQNMDYNANFLATIPRSENSSQTNHKTKTWHDRVGNLSYEIAL